MADHDNCEHCALLEEVQRLQKALNFWLPGMPETVNNQELYERLDHDISLLVGFDGPYEGSADDRGWIKLNDEQSPDASDGGEK